MIWAFVAALAMVPLGVFVIRPRVAPLFQNDFQGIKTEAIVGPMVTLAVFMSALVIAQATAGYQRAYQSTSSEGSSISLLFEHAGMLPDNAGKDIQAASVCYARAVTHREFPALANLHTAPEVDHWADQFDLLVPKVLSGPGPIVGQIVALNRAQSEARLTRVNEASTNIPTLTIVLMIVAVLAVILALSSLAIKDMRRAVLVPVALLLATLLGGSLFLVDQLERPFSGIIKVSPSVISNVARDAGAAFATRYPGVALPCDATGRPTA